VFAVELLVREALTNAVMHGCHADPSKRVKCILRLRPGRLIIAVRDDGCGFDWITALEQEADLDACSGRGMLIYEQYADRIRFGRKGNSVVIVKLLDKDLTTMNETLVTWEDKKAVVQPAGDVVAATVPELRSAMKTVVAEGAHDMVVDLRNTRMVDSSGLGLFIAAHNSLEKVGGKLSVIGATADILSLFRTMRMHQRISVAVNDGSGEKGQIR
jgi:serine/threonine-protein kinase RsbW